MIYDALDLMQWVKVYNEDGTLVMEGRITRFTKRYQGDERSDAVRIYDWEPKLTQLPKDAAEDK